MLTPEQYKNSAKIIQYGLDVAFNACTERNRVAALNEVQNLLAELITDAQERLKVSIGDGFEC